MMNRDETLQYIADLGLVQGYVAKLIYTDDLQDYDDFVQECFLQICEVKPEKWEALWLQGTKKDGAKAVRGYVSGIIHRNVKSRNSRLWSKMKKHKERELPFSSCFITEEEGWDEGLNTI